MRRSFLFGIGVVFAIGYLTITSYLAHEVLSYQEPTIKSSYQSISLTGYFENKGINESPSISFAAITTQEVLAATTSAEVEPTPAPAIPTPITKSSYTISLLGDSMIDTLGLDLPHLQKELKKRFPQTQFPLTNAGVGASNIESGLSRLPGILSGSPDIVVVESFAYNHWDNTQGDLDRQWLTLAKIVETIKNNNSNTKIVLAATIAPYCPTYTDGSANLPPERKYSECETVKIYLQNMVNFAQSQGYPFADAFHASLTGNEGTPIYINQSDHIHPSDAGKALFSQKVAAAIDRVINDKLILCAECL